MSIHNPVKIILLSILFSGITSGLSAQQNFITNPIYPGYFADPTIIKDNGKWYIYATIDPWGSDELGVLETKDFKTFTRKHINWPTKKACQLHLFRLNGLGTVRKESQ